MRESVSKSRIVVLVGGFVSSHGMLTRIIAGAASIPIYLMLGAESGSAILLTAFLLSAPPHLAAWILTGTLANLLLIIVVPAIGTYPILGSAIVGGGVLLWSHLRSGAGTVRPAHATKWTPWARPIAFVFAAISLVCTMFDVLPVIDAIAWAGALGLVGCSLPRAAHNPRNMTRANVLTATAGVFVAVLLLELGARAVFAPIVPATPLYVPHPVYHFTLGRDVHTHQRIDLTEGPPFESEVVVSAQGIHAREIYGPKADDEFRIVVLGDSLTAGHGLAWEDTIGQALQSLLAKEPLKKRCVVINCGVGAYGPWQERGFLRERGFPLEPDLVVHQLFAANDVHDTLMQFGRRTEAYPVWWHRRVEEFRRQSMLRYRIHDGMMRVSRVYQLLARDFPGATLPGLASRFRFLRVKTTKFPPTAPRNWAMELHLAEWYPELQYGWDQFEKDVLAVRDDCRERGIGYVAFNLPYYVSLRDDVWELNARSLGPGQDYVKLKDTIVTETFLRREGVPYVDVTTVLARQTNQRDLFHHSDGHLKKAGAWLVAGEIRDFLIESALVPVETKSQTEPPNRAHD